MSKSTFVRREFSEEAVWREALGNREPLLVFSVQSEALDAPDWIPTGGCHSQLWKSMNRRNQ